MPTQPRSLREAAILDRARRGVALKAIAIDLSVSCSTVSAVLSRVAARAGVSSRVELIVRLSERPHFDDARLTRAELDTARLALDGHSNAEIALRRGVACRTVANQLASTYQKLGVGSRAGLAALGAPAEYQQAS